MIHISAVDLGLEAGGTFIAPQKPRMTTARGQELCEEKARLLKKYDEATKAFSGAVAALQRQMAVIPKEEYDRLRGVTEEKRLTSDQARLALEQHVAVHCC